MAVDVAGDVAASMFARRGVGRLWKEIYVLALRGGEWTWLGGGASDGDQDLLADRPAVLPGSRSPGSAAGADPRIMSLSGRGGVLDDGGTDPWSPGTRWISYADLRVKRRCHSCRLPTGYWSFLGTAT
jgi:hypothetical protein